MDNEQFAPKENEEIIIVESADLEDIDIVKSSTNKNEAPETKPLEVVNQEETEENIKELPDYIALIKWIETNPRYAHLVAMVDKEGEIKPSQPDNLFVKIIKNYLLSIPTEYYGKSYVTDKVRDDAVVVSRLINASNLIDFVGNSPLWFFAFKSLGSGWAFFITIVMNIIILKFSNDLSTKINTSNKNYHLVKKAGLFSGLVILNVIQSVASGIGVELFNNQSKLTEVKAQEIVEKQMIIEQENMEVFKNATSPQYVAVKERCEKGQEELNSLPHSNPRWYSLYAEMHGTWQEHTQDWDNVPMEQLPVCRQLVRLQNELFVNYENAQNNFNNLLIARNDVGNDLLFLDSSFPNVYQSHFTPEGELKSSLELVTLATNSFLTKLFDGKLGAIALPLFILSFSVISSFVSCIITWNYSEDEYVKLSWDEELKQKRDLWLEAQWRNLINDTQQNQ
ncbi:hypothetical protein IQ215_03565 [Cyanobacterium stanieri LEGE 03274]|uniref:Uncharacterized protein n=1 Tax=Cyanobacterium stanieri LEGE 03274 TaxID=1828756 RepID=A0ABR9V1K9_9CHRO|nr:hypothetical protein [Cyanobacterium stanieri]MBE9221765.1 hypothetical protein [Cyanobacterium stanieri LEGE 03274]